MKYVVAVQSSVDGRELVSTVLEPAKVGDLSARWLDSTNIAIFEGEEQGASSYVEPGTPVRLCRWKVTEVDKDGNAILDPKAAVVIKEIDPT